MRFSIFGYYGQGNAGDEAILSALVDGIRAKFNVADIGVYTANASETEKNYGVKGLKFFDMDLKSLVRGVVMSDRAIFARSIMHFFRSDVVLIGGGGLFFDTPETNKWMYGYTDLIRRAKRFGKKVAVLGVSVGPFHHQDSYKAIAEAFDQVDIISVRDNGSRDLLVKCGVHSSKICVIPDLVFTLTSASDHRVEEILRSECFPLSKSRKNILITPCCYNVDLDGWAKQYARFCEYIVDSLDVNIWFIPMQRNDDYDDLKAIDNIVDIVSESTLKKIYRLKGRYSAKEVQGVIGRSNFVLAERLHGSIMAINTGVPLLSIAYMPKVNGVLELSNLTDCIIEMRSFLNGDALDSIVSRVKDQIHLAPEEALCKDMKTRAELSFEKLLLLR